VLYTLGGLENLQTAKKYYASTIDLTGGKNTRALFGVCLVSTNPFFLTLFAPVSVGEWLSMCLNMGWDGNIPIDVSILYLCSIYQSNICSIVLFLFGFG
jgi:hypothetical protein